MRRESANFSLAASLPSTPSRESQSDTTSTSTERTELSSEQTSGESQSHQQQQQPPQNPQQQARASFSISGTSTAEGGQPGAPPLFSIQRTASISQASGVQLIDPAVETQSIGAASSSASVRDDTESLDTDSSDNSEGSAPREVGHNLYILAHKLAKFNKELSVLLKSKESEALSYYAAHTAQIEVKILEFFLFNLLLN